MACIPSACSDTPTLFYKIFSGVVALAVITAIFLAVIGLAASPDGPFNVIVGLGPTANGMILGISLFVLILDLFWMALLYKKKKEPLIDQPDSFQVFPFYAPSNQTIHFATNVRPILPSLLTNLIDFLQSPFAGLKPRLDPVSELPLEISLSIFSYFTMEDLGRCCLVNRQWNVLATDPALWNAIDLRQISPHVTVFDEWDWKERYGKSVETAPQLNHKVIPVLKQYLSRTDIPNKSLTVLTVPEGFTINEILTLAQGEPDAPDFSGFASSEESTMILEKFGDVPVEKTYNIIITNYPMIFFKEFETPTYEFPQIIEVALMLLIVRPAITPPHYGTGCTEEMNNKQVFVGSYIPQGHSYTYSPCLDYDEGWGKRYAFSCAVLFKSINNPNSFVEGSRQ